MSSIFNTIRTYKKTTVFVGVIISYGVKFVMREYENELLRRVYCKEANKFGVVPIRLGERPRKITVFLNPAASSGSGVKLFRKNAAPLLHIAGLEINLVKTEYEGQVKKFLEVLKKKDTDGIVVAGGDGTLLELVTGVMRKDDPEFNKSIPIGVIPLGNTNRFAKLMYGSDKEQVKLILDATMAVVNGFSKGMDVLKIEGEDSRSTYAMSGMEVGAFTDAKSKANKYWIFGPLKHRWTYIWNSIRRWPNQFKAKISYILATEENTQIKIVKKKQEVSNGQSSWLSFLFGQRIQKLPDVYEEIENDEGDEALEEEVTTELTLMTPIVQQSESNSFRAALLGLGPTELSRTEFINEGFKRVSAKDQKFGSENNRSMVVKKIHIQPEIPEGTELWYTIDGERFEAMPIDVRLLKNKLKVFYNHVPLPSL